MITTAILVKRTLKGLAWTVLVILFLLIAIVLLLKLPYIQNKVIGYTTSYISSKTHTQVSIGRVSLALSGALTIDELFLDDEQKDTLVYARHVRVSVSLPALLSKELKIQGIFIDNAFIDLNRSKTDTLFNYVFLITSFSDPSADKTKDTTSSSWKISADKIELSGIRLIFNDEYGGSSLNCRLGHLKLSIDEMDLNEQLYAIEALELSGLVTNILITPSQAASKNEEASVLPRISAEKININSSALIFTDSINKISLNAGIEKLLLKDLITDLQNQKIDLKSISLEKSSIAYIQTDSIPSDTLDKAKEESNWIVSVKDIDLDKNTLSYSQAYKKAKPHYFDPSHQTYRALMLRAEKFVYSKEKTALRIKNFSAVDANNFSIQSFSTQFTMNRSSMSARGLKLQTAYSSIDADLRLSYPSLDALADSFELMHLNAMIRNIRAKTADILYFEESLKAQAFFQSPENFTVLSGAITGPYNLLQGQNISLRTGTSNIRTDFMIRGLQDPQLAYYEFPNLKVSTGRKDIEMVVGKKAIPESILLPNSISLQVDFKGQIRSFLSTVGLSSDYGPANLFAKIDKYKNFTVQAETQSFDLGLLLNNKKMFGPVSIKLQAQGHGLDKNTVQASVEANASRLYLNQYTYKNLLVNGKVSGQRFEGKINLDDENAALDFDGFVDLNKDHEQYKFLLDLKGADLQKLHLAEKDMRISLQAVSDLKGNSISEINGKAGVTHILIIHNEKKYVLDSLLFVSINEKGKSEIKLSSAIVGIDYKGTFSPPDMYKQMKIFLNNYFELADTGPSKPSSQPQNFEFEVLLQNHPVLTEVFFPELKEFEPGSIRGNFDSEKKYLKVDASMNRILYGSTLIKDFSLDINSDERAITYNLKCSELSNAQLKIENISLSGKAEENSISSSLASTDEEGNKKILVNSSFTKQKETYTIKIDPTDFFIMNERWNVSPGNYIAFNKSGVLFHDLVFEKSSSHISIASVHNRFNDDIAVAIKDLQLEELSGIIEKDTSLAKGIVHGNILLKKINNSTGLVSDLSVTNLIIREVPVGNFQLRARNDTPEKFLLEASVDGANKLSMKGFFLAAKDPSIDLNADIQTISMKTLEAVLPQSISSASGTLNGKFSVRGVVSAPEINGFITFNEVYVNPSALNSNLYLKHESLEFRNKAIYFNSFRILDSLQNVATVNGNIGIQNPVDPIFLLDISTDNFSLFNSTARNNETYYGKMVIDSKIKLRGNAKLPVVNARVKLRKGSNFTFAVPESELTTDKGEGVVEFNDTILLHPIITRDKMKAKGTTEIRGFDVSSIVEVDREATLKLLIDPYSGDSLVVKGDATLSLVLDPSGKVSLTGAYNVIDGSYLVSLESILKRKFDIAPGSTIIWNGDPLDATVNINAVYHVRASPADLVAEQLSGLNDSEQSGFKQKYPFEVLLKLRGELMHPDITFEIQLPPEERGALGGAVNAKLNMLNEDPNSLNKQVFALLVLGRFVQEDPLQTENNAATAAARTTVSRFLSAQLNQLSAKMVPGVELNFDIQSYDEYGGQGEGRTEVEVGLKKQLFNERLSVQVGGTVDVEGEKVKQNSASDITSDITLDYKLSKDGRYRLKGFRHNQYEGALEGEIVETGAGLLYIKDFDKWKDLFRSERRKKKMEDKKKQ